MVIKGKIHMFGDNVNTDDIIPAVYLDTTNPVELAKHCMVGIDSTFPDKVASGEIMVANKNFGCGSSREHAPIAIKACGIACVIASSFARIFYRNAINIGLPIIVCPEAVEETKDEDVLEVDTTCGRIKNITTGKIYATAPFPEFMQRLISAGGLMEYVREKQDMAADVN
ncbi:3-isopropylmalate dehydratase small subunit [Candidatus Desantisbacteria bacterium CG2_30_40_21]|uniref:3-isopropylmalate dehydratase small subunit n=5 Tax=unclassified Candidatus Desantisiibacteriota TaxID=3106372 RepID=A0A2M7JBU0_9BACT|nr:MAG: 3-isopropylmalate dehydratase small subunit [Candidatus Desantisbacteria bacterium CG2_30_40_21]PIP41073.1 MAG: 3-isopropylmalate dehydratase small subunit [Candidatus Desantisbacteria bacterium CG23_combo_of_CG06-09_8_20_14_all_40_23]PIX16833.1 MAG: 3-isopropylmalate dehydratase small subunit [Candidatus Desantisbacteria bacterium CG_4_8_14_3_um_filter_40_12]PIY19199.1 MAG: 3-isopropylmalate dehydratase small subunit [Candidatus Desantisbacteria bacterium CG_4_10_14_3_um_filter_40_18]P